MKYLNFNSRCHRCPVYQCELLGRLDWSVSVIMLRLLNVFSCPSSDWYCDIAALLWFYSLTNSYNVPFVSRDATVNHTVSECRLPVEQNGGDVFISHVCVRFFTFLGDIDDRCGYCGLQSTQSTFSHLCGRRRATLLIFVTGTCGSWPPGQWSPQYTTWFIHIADSFRFLWSFTLQETIWHFTNILNISYNCLVFLIAILLKNV